MYRLTVSNGLEISQTDYKTPKEAQEAMEKYYEELGEGEDSSFLSVQSAFHQGEEESNVFDISEIPDDVRQMTAKEIMDSISDDVKAQLYEALQAELEENRER